MIKLARMNIQLFAEPGEPTPEPTPTPNTSEDMKKYLETIERLKSESVPKEEAERLREENRLLLQKIVNGGGEPTQEPVVKDYKEQAKEYSQTLLKEGINDYEFAVAATGLRKLILENEGVDIFTNTDGQSDYSVELAAENVANHMEDCIEECKGDPDIFKTLFNKKVK